MRKKLLGVVASIIVISSLFFLGNSPLSINKKDINNKGYIKGINIAYDNNFEYSPRLEDLREFRQLPIKDILSKGNTITFVLKTENKDWIRPIYSKKWEDPLFKERFSDPSILVETAMHRLFELPAGASLSFPLYASLGLDDFITETELPENYIGFLIINSKIKNIKALDKQVAIIAEPVRSGYQIIWIKRSELPVDNLLISLVTPDGYEIDYLPILTK
ncbi:MAG: hypothetical protein ACPLSA_05690 [Caldanaerobacter sp.]